MVLNGYPGRNDRSPGPQTLPVCTLERPDLFLSPQGRWRIASQRDAYKSPLLAAQVPGVVHDGLGVILLADLALASSNVDRHRP